MVTQQNLLANRHNTDIVRVGLSKDGTETVDLEGGSLGHLLSEDTQALLNNLAALGLDLLELRDSHGQVSCW